MGIRVTHPILQVIAIHYVKQRLTTNMLLSEIAQDQKQPCHPASSWSYFNTPSK